MGLRVERVVGLVLLVAAALTLAAAAESQTVPRNLVLERTFECSQWPQPVDFDLVKVTIDVNGPRRDGMHTGQRCSGRIGRLEIDTAWDGVKVQGGLHNLVVEGGYVHCSEVPDAVHQDGVQAMGGEKVTFRNLDIDCGTNSAMFFNTGAGGNNRPTDIVCDGCTLRKENRNNRTVRINNSTRSGVRNSVIYWCGPSCPGPAVLIGAATSPVNDGNTIVQYGTSPPPQPETPQLSVCANRTTTFDLCWPAMTGVSRFNYYRDGAQVSSTNNGATVRVRFGKLVGTHRYGVGAVQAVGEGRAEVTVTR